MPGEAILRPDAELDAAGAAFWYEEQSRGLGGDFLEAMDEVLLRVGSNPMQFPTIESGVRRALLRRFPYAVYFVTEAERAIVIAILHLHRHPDTWRQRT